MIKLEKLNIGFIQTLHPLSQMEMEHLWGAGTTYSVDNKGNFIIVSDSNHLTYDVILAKEDSYSIIGCLEITPYVAMDEYGNQYPGSQIEGVDYGFFKFLADNTDVEWEAFLNGGVHASDSTNCILQTSHKNSYCVNDNNTLETEILPNYDTCIHNHPGYNANLEASESDKTAWRCMYAANSHMSNYGIYCKTSIRNYTYEVHYGF